MGAPNVQGPSVNMPGMSGPYLDSSGNLHGPSMGMPSISQGNISGGPSMNARSFGMSDLAKLGGLVGGASDPEAGANTPGPLSSAGAPINPQALSGGMGGATEMFRAPVSPQPMSQQQPAAPMGPGEFTRMMQAPPAASAPAVGVPVPQSQQAAPAPSLFSQPVAAPKAPAAPTAAPTAVPEAAKKGIMGMSPMVLIASVVVILLIAILIWVMLQSGR